MRNQHEIRFTRYEIRIKRRELLFWVPRQNEFGMATLVKLRARELPLKCWVWRELGVLGDFFDFSILLCYFLSLKA